MERCNQCKQLLVEIVAENLPVEQRDIVAEMQAWPDAPSDKPSESEGNLVTLAVAFALGADVGSDYDAGGGLRRILGSTLLTAWFTILPITLFASSSPISRSMILRACSASDLAAGTRSRWHDGIIAVQDVQPAKCAGLIFRVVE
jgi:hypothetical protein